MTMQRQSLASVVFVILVSGCATMQPMPVQSQPRSPALAIDIVIEPPMGIGSRNPAGVYFIRLDEPDDLLQQSLIRSNYVKGSRAYLLNAPPGTYAAVATMFLTPVLGYGTYVTYFPQEVVERTRVAVREGQVAYMGTYVLGTSVGLDGADALQKHYKNVIAPSASTGTFQMGLSGNVHYKGSLEEGKNDESSRREFLLHAKEDLAGSGWAALLK